MNFENCTGSNILILVGRSGSGKSDIASMLKNKHGYKKAAPGTAREPYETLESELAVDGPVVCILTPNVAKEVKERFSQAYIVNVETSLKTATLRMIAREEELVPERLQDIAICGVKDTYIYRNIQSDLEIVNESGTVLEDIADRIVKAHEKYRIAKAYEKHTELCDNK